MKASTHASAWSWPFDPPPRIHRSRSARSRRRCPPWTPPARERCSPPQSLPAAHTHRLARRAEKSVQPRWDRQNVKRPPQPRHETAVTPKRTERPDCPPGKALGTASRDTGGSGVTRKFDRSMETRTASRCCPSCPRAGCEGRKSDASVRTGTPGRGNRRERGQGRRYGPDRALMSGSCWSVLGGRGSSTAGRLTVDLPRTGPR